LPNISSKLKAESSKGVDDNAFSFHLSALEWADEKIFAQDRLVIHSPGEVPQVLYACVGVFFMVIWFCAKASVCRIWPGDFKEKKLAGVCGECGESYGRRDGKNTGGCCAGEMGVV
jgi:hypothetical protein